MSVADILNGRTRDFKRVFLGTEEGQRVLAEIYKMCGMNRQIHVPGDEHSTSFNAGAHRVGQGIQSILSQDEQDIMGILRSQKRDITTGVDDYDPFQQNRKEGN